MQQQQLWQNGRSSLPTLPARSADLSKVVDHASNALKGFIQEQERALRERDGPGIGDFSC